MAEVQQAPLQLAFVRERDARSGARGDWDRGSGDWREGRDRDGGPAGEGQVRPPPLGRPGRRRPPLECLPRVWAAILGSPPGVDATPAGAFECAARPFRGLT